MSEKGALTDKAEGRQMKKERVEGGLSSSKAI